MGLQARPLPRPGRPPWNFGSGGGCLGAFGHRRCRKSGIRELFKQGLLRLLPTMALLSVSVVDAEAQSLAHSSSHENSVASGSSVSINSVASGTDKLYVVFVGTKSGTPRISSISGGSLTWNDLGAQCGSRNQTMIDVWWAFGSPASAFTVSVTMTSSAALAAAVEVYTGAASSGPINFTGENTNGPAGACSGGTDNTTPNVRTSLTA